MIYYKDMTFCSMACGNTGCTRNFTKEEENSATSQGLPVALSDYSKRCGAYVKPEENV